MLGVTADGRVHLPNLLTKHGVSSGTQLAQLDLT